MNAEVHPVVKISLARSNVVFDERLTALLHLVDEGGAVQDSCQRMGIPLSSAWYLLAQAEDSLGFPLLRNRQGEYMLTEKGKKLMDSYDEFHTAVQAKAEMLFESFLPFGEAPL